MHRCASDGGPSLYLTAAAAYKLLEAKTCNEIRFSKWQKQKVANCDIFPGSSTNKTSCKQYFYFFFRNTSGTQAGKIVIALIRMQTSPLKSHHTDK